MQTPSVDTNTLLQAYQEYGLRPMQGMFYSEPQHAACALTVWWMYTHQGTMPWTPEDTFIGWREWPERWVDGFLDGFDQRVFRSADTLEELLENDDLYSNGYGQGERSRVALGLDITTQKGRPR